MARHKSECFAILPRLTDAMLSLGARLQQRNIPLICRRYEADFIADGAPLPDGKFYVPNWAAWVAWDDEAQALHGYLVGVVELFADQPVVYVNQCEIVSKHVPLPLQEQILSEFDAWTREKGCTEILMMTRIDYPRLWKRFGFERWRAVYRRPV